MTELHVPIPDDVAERLADRAEREHTTSEELVTDAVAKLVGPALGKLGFIGLGSSGRSDISELSTTMEFGFIGIGHAKPGFSARAAEERLEAEGFV